MSALASATWTQRLKLRALPLAIVLGVLLLLGFYAATNPEHLDHSPELSGADYVGYAICHRITERSFSIGGRQMPLCARCTGMYLGLSLVFGILALAGRRRWNQLPPIRVLLVLIGFIGLMGIDGLNSYSHFFPNAPHLYEPRNELRLATGMGAGLAMGAIVFPGLAQVLWREQTNRPSLVSLRELAGLVLLAGGLFLLVLSNRAPILYVLALGSAAGVLLVLTAINCMTLLIAFKKDAQSDNWRQAVWPLALGLALAVLEVALVSYGRYSLTGTMVGLPGF